MSSRKIFSTVLAPKAIGPYSQAVVANSPTVFLSGQIGMDVRTGQLVTESVEAQARQAFTNMKAVVEATGATLDHVVKVNIFILNFDHFPTVNEVMKEFFAAPYPARSTVGVAQLPRDAQIEIEAVVQLPTTAKL